jgi:signal transduction histidine kinase
VERDANLAQKTAEARILQQVSGEINSTLDLDEILHIVLRTMDELFGFQHSLILLLDDSGEKLRVAASRGYQEQAVGAEVAVGTGLIGVVAKKRRMMRLSNLGQQRAYLTTIRKEFERAGRGGELGEATKLPGLPEAESQIAIPLTIKDQLIGVFSVESEEKRVFTERDEVLMSIVANQAASAIHNARLYRAEQERRQELAEAHQRLQLLNDTLEERVRARTEDLHRANRELKDAQAQLIQTAKMAALGDLVAGVAHEINTPIGSIRASADLARRALTIVREVLESEEFHPRASQSGRLGRSVQALEDAMATTLSGAERIIGIVKSLRQFARLDEAERKRVDIHEGIDSTLTLVGHKLKQGIEVIRDYGDLPKIECFPSRLNQVFMNLLLNAVESMPGGGRITISTRREGDQAVLDFADTGGGIPKEHLERVFDPGFTTKGVGVGTGLGLAISYRIVQSHQGTITVSSEPGQGSRFTIRLPLAAPRPSLADWQAEAGLRPDP